MTFSNCWDEIEEWLGDYHTAPPTPPPSPESPCPKKISRVIKDMYEYNPRGRRSLQEIFELVLDQEQYIKACARMRHRQRKMRMSTGGKK